MVRRSALNAAGSFNEDFTHAEDYDLWLRLARRFAIGYIDAPLIQVRRHGSNISKDIAAHQKFEKRALQGVNPIEAMAAFTRLHPDAQRRAEAWIWFLLRSGNECLESECRRAVAESPNSAALQFALGVFFYDAGAYAGAYESFREIKDHDAAGLNNFAVAAALRGDEEAARSALQAAIAMRPGYQDARSNLLALANGAPLGLTRRPLRTDLVPEACPAPLCNDASVSAPSQLVIAGIR
jgi:tetratricopeptide (TPR) repeat protein